MGQQRTQNKEGDTSLILANVKGFREIVELLIQNKANIEHENNARDTALTLAAKKGFDEVVELLLVKNANTEHKNRKIKTAFMLAASNGLSEVVKLLLRNIGTELRNKTGDIWHLAHYKGNFS
ncbi:hypothetical protein NQ314_010040 [Rhamnusium bicolor]|uniref:Ankyrin repeat protein n=1 Tax=Rhamnusium bicolor TaxID=1586634 RepID=A0AAV8XU02_9CUCU|nr:hypothetical protein NQ314_010040 [Rhamnusium bicolor]